MADRILETSEQAAHERNGDHTDRIRAGGSAVLFPSQMPEVDRPRNLLFLSDRDKK